MEIWIEDEAGEELAAIRKFAVRKGTDFKLYMTDLTILLQHVGFRHQAGATLEDDYMSILVHGS